jgi:hypothetical protein
MVMIGVYYCCMMPNFRIMTAAPKYFQAEQSYREFMTFVLDEAGGRERRIANWIESTRERPYPMIQFKNGSSMEFKSVDRDASSILTWSGDMAVVDQAESDDIDLETTMMNLGTRLRGQVGGRARLGKLILMANAAYQPVLWEIYDAFDADPNQYAKILTTYDNPYLTQSQLESMRRMFRNKDDEARMMRSERPLPKGKEFTENLIVLNQSEALDTLMSDGLSARNNIDYVVEDSVQAGIVKWMLPPQKDHLYIMAGDPGQANPPNRNSPPVLVFDVTGFPQQPATLAAFWWVYGYGSYLPFINVMHLLYEMYHPLDAAFDATGTQKAFDDLGILDQNMVWTPLDLHGLKMHMVLCTKV